MRRFHIPTMSSLLAFEAAARHESFTLAARELFLTESAVSRQIASLESSFGVPLFARAKQRVILTRAGSVYAVQVRRSLEKLDKDTLSLLAHGNDSGSLELAVLPTFASQWLIPKLPEFNGRFPDVRISMSAKTDSFSFDDTHFDAAVHYGMPTWPNSCSDFLFGETVLPICAKGLISEPLQSAADLLRYPLLHSTTRPDDWSQYLETFEVSEKRAIRGVRYELHSMLVAAAAAGLGIALVPSFAVGSDALKALDLCSPWQPIEVESQAYYLVYPTTGMHNRNLEVFRSWLLSKAEEAKPHRAGAVGAA
jgi:LysR family transcriptional regulator, glycine cleavage system transcriptional activator